MVRVCICSGDVDEIWAAHTDTLAFFVDNEDSVLTLMGYALQNGYVISVNAVDDEEDGGDKP